jgi:hypothetical protein
LKPWPQRAKDHPTTRGLKPFAVEVKPFTVHDEWYYHMRFRESMEGVTPILTAARASRGCSATSRPKPSGSSLDKGRVRPAGRGEAALDQAGLDMRAR